MKKILILILILLSFSLVGCRKKDPTNIVIAEVTHSIFYAPQYVAITKGFFEEEGLKVSYVTTPGADKVMAALISGDCQIGLAGAEATIYVYNEGLKDYAVNFAQLTQKDGSFLVGREKIDNFKFSMMKGSEVIGGRKGGMPIMVLEYVLKQSGLDAGLDNPAKEVNIRSDVEFAAIAGAFVSGQGDYVSLFEPTASLLEKANNGYVLTSIGSFTNNIPYTNYFTQKSFLDKNDEIAQKFTNAIYKAQEWVYSHSAREVAEACITHFSDSTLDDLTKVVERYKSIEAWAKTPILTEESYNHFITIMQSANALDKKPEYSKIITTEYAKKAVNN